LWLTRQRNEEDRETERRRDRGTERQRDGKRANPGLFHLSFSLSLRLSIGRPPPAYRATREMNTGAVTAIVLGVVPCGR